MQSCARRETRKETGLNVHPNRCELVLEVADEFSASARLPGEPCRRLIGRFLPDLARSGGAPGRYLGNARHPQRGDP